MAVNGSGIRDTARVLEISPTSVIETIRKSNKEGETVAYVFGRRKDEVFLKLKKLLYR